MINKPFNRKKSIMVFGFIGIFWFIVSIITLILGISLKVPTLIYLCIILFNISLLTFSLCLFERLKTVTLFEDKITFKYFYHKSEMKYLKELIIIYDEVECVGLKNANNYMYNDENQSISFQMKNGEEYDFPLHHYNEERRRSIIDYLVKKINVN